MAPQNNSSAMDDTQHREISIEKLRDMNLNGSFASLETGATDLMENSMSDSSFSQSMDFDRHSAQVSQRFRGGDDSDTNWDDSFAVDDGNNNNNNNINSYYNISSPTRSPSRSPSRTIRMSPGHLNRLPFPGERSEPTILDTLIELEEDGHTGEESTHYDDEDHHHAVLEESLATATTSTQRV